MSGIFGFVNLDGRPASPEEFQKMASAMSHWGPDGIGSVISANAAFGHALLIVTHESPYEKMPHHDTETDVLFTAAARLDNRDELCDLFGIPHPQRPTTPDGRLVWLAWRKWGREACRHIFGDWSFAAWDKKEKKLFLARDHMGNTGLYYYFKPPLVVFASSSEAVLSHSEVPRRLNELHLARRMIFDYSEETFFQTFWEDVNFLPASHFAHITDRGKQIEKYWRLEEAPPIRFASDDEYAEGFLEQFRRAVRVRLNSIRPVASTLSAGLDSSSVTALAAQELKKRNQPLVAYTSVPLYPCQHLFPHRITDEWPLAHEVAKLYENIEHVPINAEETTILDGIKKSLEITGEPQHASTNMFWIISMLQNAKAKDFGVLLTGQLGNGGISWNGGANYVYYLFAKGQWRKGWQALRAYSKNFNISFPRSIKSQLLRPLLKPTILQCQNFLHRGENLLYAYPHADFIKRMGLNNKNIIQERVGPFTERRRIIRLGGAMAGKVWSFIQAYHELEVRDPSADVRLLEYCKGVPVDQYTSSAGRRMLIRRAMKGLLPDNVRLNTLHGKQAADALLRLVTQESNMYDELRRLKAASQVKKYIDIDTVRKTWYTILSNKADSKQIDAFLRSVSYANLIFSASSS